MLSSSCALFTTLISSSTAEGENETILNETKIRCFNEDKLLIAILERKCVIATDLS